MPTYSYLWIYRRKLVNDSLHRRAFNLALESFLARQRLLCISNQLFLSNLFAELRRHNFWQLDSTLAHAFSILEPLEATKRLFFFCVSFNLKLHPKKRILFAKGICWCGRINTSAINRFEPRRIDGIPQMEPPTNGAQPQKIVCAIQRMGN